MYCYHRNVAAESQSEAAAAPPEQKWTTIICHSFIISTISKWNLTKQNKIFIQFKSFYFTALYVRMRRSGFGRISPASSERAPQLTAASSSSSKPNWPSPRPRRSSWSQTRTLNVFHLIFCVCFIVQAYSHALNTGRSHTAGAERRRGERRLLFSLNGKNSKTEHAS